MGWYRGYRGKSVGRIFHFLYHYCGLSVAEHAEISNYSISYGGKEIATFKYSDKFGEKDVPEFEFLNENWNYNQIFKREEAIKEGCPEHPEVGEEEFLHNDAVVLFKLVNEKAWQSADLSYQMFHNDGSRLKLFLYKGMLMFKSWNYFYWNADMGCWLRAS